jgi:cephalosporin hydroxylase
MNSDEQKIVNDFHNLYHLGPKAEGSVYKRTTWMGIPCSKCPLDMWMYQEILHEVQPDFILETGTFKGGSALYLAHLCDLLGKGRIVSLDVEIYDRPRHPRVTYVTGSSADRSLIEGIFQKVGSAERVMAILDSDHSEPHVTQEMGLLAPYVSVGSYMIVEDTNLNGHPTYATHGPGPFEAVEKFMRRNPNFEIDKSRERFLLTFNPGGYLKKIFA